MKILLRVNVINTYKMLVQMLRFSFPQVNHILSENTEME